MRPAQLKKYQEMRIILSSYYIRHIIIYVYVLCMYCVSKTAVNLSGTWGTSHNNPHITSQHQDVARSWLMVTCCCGYGSKPNGPQTVPFTVPVES